MCTKFVEFQSSEYQGVTVFLKADYTWALYNIYLDLSYVG